MNTTPTDDKPSIAMLKQVDREMLAAPWDTSGDTEDGEVIDRDRGKVIARIGRHPITANTAGISAIRIAERALLAALAKVRP